MVPRSSTPMLEASREKQNRRGYEVSDRRCMTGVQLMKIEDLKVGDVFYAKENESPSGFSGPVIQRYEVVFVNPTGHEVCVWIDGPPTGDKAQDHRQFPLCMEDRIGRMVLHGG